MLGAVNESIQTHGFAIPGANFINLLIGVGLLKGWRICRWYALLVFGSALLFALPMAVWSAFNSGKIVFQFPSVLIDDLPHAIVPTYVTVMAMIGYIVISAWAVWVLMRRDVRKFFQDKANLPTPVPV